MFDQNKNINIIIAGILTLTIAVGIARFSFTSLLPAMLEDSLPLTTAGILASINYVGYLSGSIFAMFIKDFHIKVICFRLGMIAAVATTITMGITDNYEIWLLARIIAGFGSAMGLVVGSAIVMSKLDFKDKTKAMGIHFSGIAFAIVISDLIVRVAMIWLNWQGAWIVLSIAGAIIALYPLIILDFSKEVKAHHKKILLTEPVFSPFVLVLIVAYFTAGIGYVVQGTFLPDIINSLKGLEGLGALAWVLAGLMGIPSSIIWMRLAAKYESVPVIIVAMLLQVISILIPTFSTNPMLNIIAALFYGGTFVGLVALFLNLGGKLAKSNPVILMGALTTAYGIGQVLGPLYASYLTQWNGNYTLSLYVTAIIVFSGSMLLLIVHRLKKIPLYM